MKLKVLIILILALFISACEDDSPLEAEEHFEAVGLRLYTSGILVAEIYKGETSDTLEVHEGETSDHFDIVFLDDQKNEIDPPTDENMSFEGVIADTNIATVWQHPGEEGGFEFHIIGKEEGETYIEIFVNHNDHPDYRSGNIPVKVEHEEGGTHEHFEAVGMLFYQDGNEVASILRGVSSDSLIAPLDELSDHFEIKFYDEDEHIVEPPTSDELTLAWEIADTSMVEVYQHPGEEGGFEFHLRGKKSGETTIEFKVNHDGHADFTSGDIKIAVQ